MNSIRHTPTGAIALCAADNGRLATCGVLVEIEDGAPEWVMLMPAGRVAPDDSREPWMLKDIDAVIAASAARLNTASIDYDHGTNIAGGSSRAAGWIKELAPAGPAGTPGIWARVTWTKPGKEAVAGKEYRFISPTFRFNKANEVTCIVRAALTNDPALRELPALASQQPMETSSVNEDLKKVAAALGLDPETATIDDVLAAIAALNENATAMAAKKTALCAVLKAAGLGEDIAKFDDAATVAICAKLKTAGKAADKDGGESVAAMQTQIDTLQKEVATLSADRNGDKAETAVAAAITAGKITPAQKEWAIGYCSRDPKGFAEFVGKAPTILKSGRTVPAGDGGDKGEAGLDESQLAICNKLGVKPEDFKATAAAMGIKE